MRIDQLPNLATPASSDYVLVQRGSASYKTPANNLPSNIDHVISEGSTTGTDGGFCVYSGSSSQLTGLGWARFVGNAIGGIVRIDFVAYVVNDPGTGNKGIVLPVGTVKSCLGSTKYANLKPYRSQAPWHQGFGSIIRNGAIYTGASTTYPLYPLLVDGSTYTYSGNTIDCWCLYYKNGSNTYTWIQNDMLAVGDFISGFTYATY